jgi:hypothetical protein
VSKLTPQSKVGGASAPSTLIKIRVPIWMHPIRKRQFQSTYDWADRFKGFALGMATMKLLDSTLGSGLLWLVELIVE